MLKGQLFGVEHGTWKASQALAELLASAKAKDATRYALNYVGVREGRLVVTDGRKLFVVTPQNTFTPPIEDGFYYLTGEGFLLKTESEKGFPKWEDVIPKEPVVLGEFPLDDAPCQHRAEIVKVILGANCTLRLDWLLATLDNLFRCGCQTVTVQKAEGDNPVMITTETADVKFLYIQMPFTPSGDGS